jgi:fatty acid desaturase
MLLRAAGRLTAEERTFVPETEQRKVPRTSRIWLAIYGLTAAACLGTGSVLPALYIGLPRLYGCSLEIIFGLTQHAGLGEDVLDHRLNSRTIYLNPVFRFIYWNMNYHVAHHMFPLVPYHMLPELHKETRHDIPVPLGGLWAAYRQIIPAILRQLKDPTFFVWQQLPPTARPHPQRAAVAGIEP